MTNLERRQSRNVGKTQRRLRPAVVSAVARARAKELLKARESVTGEPPVAAFGSPTWVRAMRRYCDLSAHEVARRVGEGCTAAWVLRVEAGRMVGVELDGKVDWKAPYGEALAHALKPRHVVKRLAHRRALKALARAA